jgi:hypothetical protein
MLLKITASSAGSIVHFPFSRNSSSFIINLKIRRSVAVLKRMRMTWKIQGELRRIEPEGPSLGIRHLVFYCFSCNCMPITPKFPYIILYNLVYWHLILPIFVDWQRNILIADKQQDSSLWLASYKSWILALILADIKWTCIIKTGLVTPWGQRTMFISILI